MSGRAFSASSEEVMRNRAVLLFVAASVCTTALYRHWPASRVWVPAALAGIAVAIWHGAYDTVIAGNLWQPRYGGKWLLPFVASYVALACVVVAAWWLYPVAALIAFLLYSGLHFGMETEAGRSPLQIAGAVALGCLPIAAACHWQAASVAPIFTTMLRGKAELAEGITTMAGHLLLPCIVLSLAQVVRDRREFVRRPVLLAAQVLLFRFCPPVLAFAVFFCLLHTPEHLIETSRTAGKGVSMDRMWRNLRKGTGPWLISLAGVAIAAWAGRQSVQAYTGVLFIALSALTVPHMALAMLLTAESSRGSRHSFLSAQRAAQI